MKHMARSENGHNDNKIIWGKNKKNLPLVKVRNYLKQKQNKTEVKTGHQKQKQPKQKSSLSDTCSCPKNTNE